MKQRLYVNTYEVDRVYGGPEEGGWWFNTYSPVASRRVYGERQARQWMIKLESQLVEPEISLYSVMYAGGKQVVFIESHPATHQPKERPHYE